MRTYTGRPKHNPGALFLQNPMSPVNSPHAETNIIYIIIRVHVGVCGCVRSRNTERKKTDTSRGGNFRETLDFIYTHCIVL